MLSSFFRRNVELVEFSVAFQIAVILCPWLLASNDGREANGGFLLLGTFVVILTTLLSGRIRRATQRRDLANRLYVELADRVARCCFDMEDLGMSTSAGRIVVWPI